MTANMNIIRSIFVLGFVFLTACGTIRNPITACEKIGGIEPICGFSNPEDMEVLPDHQTLIISQIGSINHATSGKLVFFDTKHRFVQHQGAPMGAATIGQQVGDSLYLGSFTGDRIVKIPYQFPPKK